MPAFLRMSRTGSVRSWDDACRYAHTPEMHAAIEFFHRALRDDWPGWDLPEKWEGAAPLACNLHTAFQRGPREWERLHALAQTLSSQQHLGAVVGRRGLGSPRWTDYYAAVMTLEVSSGFRQAGRLVELVQETEDESPDARITVASRAVTTEFKALHEPEEAERWDMLYRKLTDAVAAQNLDVWSLEIYPSPKAIEHTDVFVEGLITILKQRIRLPQELPEETGRAWFRENPLRQGGWNPPISQTDDLKRLIAKLKGKWYRKVRTIEGPAILVVRTQMLAASDERSVEAVANTVAAVLNRELPSTARFSAVLVYEEPMWPPPLPVFVMTDTHRLVLGSSDGRSYRVALLVPNPDARVRLTEDEIDGFVGPRMLW